MTHRTIHIGASFAIVLVAYWSYALVAVPWIEPSPPVAKAAGTDTPLPNVPRGKELAVLFPPRSRQFRDGKDINSNDEFWKAVDEKEPWQLHDAKIINNGGQGMLLWQKYQNNANGWVDLTPLTVIFISDENETDPAVRLQHAVVLEVPEGANLHFDRPLDLNKGGIGRLIEGRLRGPVRVRSRGKRPDHQDDLLVLTHDVDLSEQRVTTANDVDFQWGLNSGRGRQMEIKLLPRLGPRVANQDGPNIGGIEQIQFEHVERLHLDMGSGSAAGPAGGSAAPVARSQPAGPPKLGALSAHAAPVEITCRGPFRFNLIEQKATFRDQVDVLRIQPNGPCDRMSCELLSIYFARPAQLPGGAPPSKQHAPGFDLKPARLEAQGTPTTVTAPMDHVQARAERLQYNLLDGQIYLQDTQEVTLQKDANEIHSQSLRYTPGPPNHTGQFQLLAAGPGWLRGDMADRPGQQLEAHWREKLEARPQDRNEVISFIGGAMLKFQAMGQLNARDIHFWLHESPPDAAGKSSFQPDRLLAEENVVGSSPQFSTKVDRLEAWFTSLPAVAAAAPAVGAAVAGAGQVANAAQAANPPHAAAPEPYVPSTTTPSPPTSLPGQEGGATAPAVAQSPPASPPGGQDPAVATDRQAHMEISGRLLQARVLLRDQQHGELSEVTVIDNVKLQETQTALPGDLPLLVTGQWLHATEASSPQSKITVKGEPAHMEGRGMSLTGPNIHIDRGANVLTMEGPGRMEKFLDRDLENRPLKQAGTVRIDWQKGMVFDGRKAHFQDSVNVTANSQLLVTGWLDVCFQQPISFSNARQQQQPPPAVERLICGDGVFIENRSVEAGQQVSYERMQLKNLDLNNISGDFHGDGPGWLVSVRRGGNGAFAMPGGPLAGPGQAATTRPVAFGPTPLRTSDPNQLTCIHLRFMKSLTGNKIRKEIVFHGQVCTAYAPVPSWTATLDSDDPKRLGPKAVVLHCDNLEVDDMSPVSGSSGGNVEMTALDNVIVEGTNFTARSARATYTQAKDLMILEGDGRSDAELFKQDGGEGTPASRFGAQKILYFLKTNQVNAEGVRSLDMNQAPRATTTPGRK